MRLLWPLLALALILVFNGIFTPGFFHIELKDARLYGHLIDILNQASPTMLVSLGMTLVIATGGVDLSVGAVMALAGSVAALLINRPGFGLPATLAITLALCLVCGLWNGGLVAIGGIQPIISTLILMVAGRGVAQLLTQGQIITFTHTGLGFVGNGYFLGLPFTATVTLIFLALAALLTRATAMGLFIESVGNNVDASRYAGVRAAQVKIFAYMFCGLCSGMAGTIAAAKIMAADANNAGMYMELDAILSVVIGGTALTGGRYSLIGALVGALIMQALTTTIRAQNVPVEYALVVKAAAALAVFLLQSESFRGMLRRKAVS